MDKADKAMYEAKKKRKLEQLTAFRELGKIATAAEIELRGAPLVLEALKDLDGAS